MSGGNHQRGPLKGEHPLSVAEALSLVARRSVIATWAVSAGLPVLGVMEVRRLITEAGGGYLSDRKVGMELVVEVEGRRRFISTEDSAVEEMRAAKPALPPGRGLVMAAFSCDDPIIGPTFASTCMTPAWVERVRELRALCIRHRLKRVEAEGTVMQWGPGNISQRLRLFDRTVLVDEQELWFEDHVYRTDVRVQTAGCSIESLEAWWFDGDGDLFVGDDIDDLRDQYEQALVEAA